MARYIDKDKLVNKLKEDYATLVKERWFDDYVQGYSSAIDDVVAEPTADAVQVIRCKDCIVPHNQWTGCPKLNGLVTSPDFYCSYGERKKEDVDARL